MGVPWGGRGVIHFGLFEVDLSAGELRREGRKVSLQEQPFQILALLLERPGEVVAREEIQQKLWPKDTFVDFDAGLNTAIRKLREALGDSADNPRFVETLPRRGYRFIAPADAARLAAAPPILPARRLRFIALASVALAGLLVVAVFVGVATRGRRERLPGRVEPGQIRSLAVLPFENLSGDPGQEYFADGMTDALITELAQVGDLRVISRTSVMQYKRAKKELPAIAEELKVDGVVEGTVVRAGPRVRVTAQLIHGPTDQHLWARSYEGEVRDILALQAEIARTIAEAVKVKLTAEMRARLGSSRQVNPSAYDSFLKGLVAASGQNYEAYRDAIVYFEDATRKQPDFALAYAMMALWNYQFSFGGPLAPKEFMPKAEAAARKALELDEHLSEAHAALGAVLHRFHWDRAGAEKEFRRALDLNPNSARGHQMFSEFLSASGRAEEGLGQAERARALDPLSVQAIQSVGDALSSGGRYDQAIVRYKAALEKFPNRPRLHYQLGRAYVLKGDLEEGIAELEKAVELSRENQRFAAYLGYAYAAAGRQSKARKILGELHQLAQQQYVSPYGIALIHVGLREKDPALAWLTKAYEAHAFELAELATDRRLDPLRSDPRFQDLARRVGPPPANVPGRSGAQ